MNTYPSNYQFSTNINRTFASTRSIPIGIQLKIWIGNFVTIIGLGFLIMGLPFSFVFISFSSFFAPSFSENDPTCKATITEVISTNSSINKTRVYEYKYEYQADGGRNYSGFGFSTGRSFDKGNEITVHYKADKPELSEANDLRTSEFGGGPTLFVLIFPLVGLIMLVFSTTKAIKQINILKIGELTDGKFLFKHPTNTKINNQTVYELTFEFTASDGQVYKAVARTYQVYRLEDEKLEKLVYDPDMPTNAVLLDALPKGIKEYFLNNI